MASLNLSSEDEHYFYLPHNYNTPVMELPNSERDMKKDTMFPQLNSSEFVNLIYGKKVEPRDFLPCYSLLEMNSDGLFVIGTNDFNSPIVDGNFIGTEDFESIVHHNIKDTEFQIPGHSTASGLRFLESNMVRNRGKFAVES